MNRTKGRVVERSDSCSSYSFNEKENKRERSTSMEIENHGRPEKKKKNICRRDMEDILERLEKVESELEVSKSKVIHMYQVNKDMLMDLVSLKKETNMKKQATLDSIKTSEIQANISKLESEAIIQHMEKDELKAQFSKDVEKVKLKLEDKNKELIDFKDTSLRLSLQQKERIDELSNLLQKIEKENEELLKELIDNKNICQMETVKARREMEAKEKKMRELEEAFDNMSKNKQKEIMRLEAEVDEFNEACDMEAIVFKKEINEKEKSLLELKRVSEEASSFHQDEVFNLKSLVHEQRQKFEGKCKECLYQEDKFVKEKKNLQGKVDELELQVMTLKHKADSRNKITDFLKGTLESGSSTAQNTRKPAGSSANQPFLLPAIDISSTLSFPDTAKKARTKMVTRSLGRSLFDTLKVASPTFCTSKIHPDDVESTRRVTRTLIKNLQNSI